MMVFLKNVIVKNKVINADMLIEGSVSRDFRSIHELKWMEKLNKVITMEGGHVWPKDGYIFKVCPIWC